jgi:hypothetical protein
MYQANKCSEKYRFVSLLSPMPGLLPAEIRRNGPAHRRLTTRFAFLRIGAAPYGRASFFHYTTPTRAKGRRESGYGQPAAKRQPT